MENQKQIVFNQSDLSDCISKWINEHPEVTIIDIDYHLTNTTLYDPETESGGLEAVITYTE